MLLNLIFVDPLEFLVFSWIVALYSQEMMASTSTCKLLLLTRIPTLSSALFLPRTSLAFSGFKLLYIVRFALERSER